MNSLSESLPIIESATIDFASDLELPGLPTRNKGILNSIHMAIINTFSLRAAFLAILGPSFILSNKMS